MDLCHLKEFTGLLETKRQRARPMKPHPEATQAQLILLGLSSSSEVSLLTKATQREKCFFFLFHDVLM